MQWLPDREPGAWAKTVRPGESAHDWWVLHTAAWLAFVLLLSVKVSLWELPETGVASSS